MLLDKIYGVLVLHSQASSDIRDKQITTLERDMTLLQFDTAAESGKPTTNNENFRICDRHFNNVILASTITKGIRYKIPHHHNWE